jgi:hypothetical protein
LSIFWYCNEIPKAENFTKNRSLFSSWSCRFKAMPPHWLGSDEDLIIDDITTAGAGETSRGQTEGKEKERKSLTLFIISLFRKLIWGPMRTSFIPFRAYHE